MVKKIISLIAGFLVLFSAVSCSDRNGGDSASVRPDGGQSESVSESAKEDEEEVLPVKEIGYEDMLSSRNINFSRNTNNRNFSFYHSHCLLST